MSIEPAKPKKEKKANSGFFGFFKSKKEKTSEDIKINKEQAQICDLIKLKDYIEIIEARKDDEEVFKF